MAKATKRMIHPEIWTDSGFGDLSPMARLLYIGLITVADDEGRLENDPRRLRAVLFPYDADVDTEALLDEVVNAGLVASYEADDEAVLAHPNWTEYQKIPPSRLRPSTYPPPPEKKRRGRPAKTKDKSKEKKPYEATAEAKKVWAYWHRTQPLKEEFKDKQLKTIDDMNRIDGLPWAEISAIVRYAVAEWVPKGFIDTPSSLRDRKSGAEKVQWEKIQTQMQTKGKSDGLDDLESQL